MARKAFRLLCMVLIVATLLSVTAVPAFASYYATKYITAGNQLAYFYVRTPNQLKYTWTKTPVTIWNRGKNYISVYWYGYQGRVYPGGYMKLNLYGRNRVHTIAVQRSAGCYRNNQSAMVTSPAPGVSVW